MQQCIQPSVTNRPSSLSHYFLLAGVIHYSAVRVPGRKTRTYSPHEALRFCRPGLDPGPRQCTASSAELRGSAHVYYGAILKACKCSETFDNRKSCMCVTLEQRVYPIPFRTRQSSSASSKVLRCSPWEDRTLRTHRIFILLQITRDEGEKTSASMQG